MSDEQEKSTLIVQLKEVEKDLLCLNVINSRGNTPCFESDFKQEDYCHICKDKLKLRGIIQKIEAKTKVVLIDAVSISNGDAFENLKKMIGRP